MRNALRPTPMRWAEIEEAPGAWWIVRWGEGEKEVGSLSFEWLDEAIDELVRLTETWNHGDAA